MMRFYRSLAISIALLFCNSALGDLSKDIKDVMSKAKDGDCQAVEDVLLPLAEQGNLEAQRNLGYFYEDYEDLYKSCGEPDLDKALKWNRLAAEQGDYY